MSSFILTHSGSILDFEEKEFTNLELDELAHSLSMQCRFTGHAKEFYSVAQHAVNVSILVPKEYKMAALLHDASEAYVSDIATPLKNIIGKAFTDLEDKAMESVGKKFGIDPSLFSCPEVKLADRHMLYLEAKEFMPYHSYWEQFKCPAMIDKEKELFLTSLYPNDAKKLFLSMYGALTNWNS